MHFIELKPSRRTWFVVKWFVLYWFMSWIVLVWHYVLKCPIQHKKTLSVSFKKVNSKYRIKTPASCGNATWELIYEAAKMASGSPFWGKMTYDMSPLSFKLLKFCQRKHSWAHSAPLVLGFGYMRAVQVIAWSDQGCRCQLLKLLLHRPRNGMEKDLQTCII